MNTNVGNKNRKVESEMKPQFMTCAKGVVTKNQLIFQILSTVLMLFLFEGMTMAADSGLGQDKIRLWYDEPASKWTDALPVGNGRLGAMVFGTVPKERLQLNEESLWAGEPTDVYPEDFSDTFRKVQRLVLEGRISEARELGLAKLTKTPTSFRSYEPLGDLWIEMDHASKIEDYRRQLDLETGIATVEYRLGDVRIKREILISAVDDVIAVRLSASKPGVIHAKTQLTRKKDMKVTAVGSGRLHMDGQIIDIPAPQGFDDNPGGSGSGERDYPRRGRNNSNRERRRSDPALDRCDGLQS